VMKMNSVPDWPLLATYLISEASLEVSSRWSNYISALPRQPYSLLYWYVARNFTWNFVEVRRRDRILRLHSQSCTASIYRFRTRAELDTYLVASPIRERAIQRITDVIGTYVHLSVLLHVPNLATQVSSLSELTSVFCFVDFWQIQ
jgi:hypothetical protein